MDTLYEKHKLRLGKALGVVPSKRPDFDLCDPKYIRKLVKYAPDKEECEEAISDMLNICIIRDGKPEKVPKKKRAMSGWVCYLKTCAKTTDLSYRDCMRNEPGRETEYYPKKAFWAAEAAKGCPSGV